MTYREFVSSLSEDLGVPKPEVARFLRAFMERVTERVVAGESISLANFGKFSLGVAPPKSVGPVSCGSSARVTFRCSRKLREEITAVLMRGKNGY
ncbi:MAG: HU family DNA-binding protein [Candidatus Thorarchaeota archaeon]|jgi:nucleoid DNA-binding protein